MANENSNVVVDRAQSHWSDLWKKEDYWAIWLGFALLIAAICIFINGAPASYKETIDKSNAIMKVEAEKAPFKTIAYIQAQDAKKGVVGTNLPIAKEIKAFIASPGKWTDNPVKSMFTSQAEADAKNAANKEKAEAAKAKAESSFAAAQAAEKLAADAGYKDASLNTAAEAAIKDWTKAKADASKASRQGQARKPLHHPALADGRLCPVLRHRHLRHGPEPAQVPHRLRGPVRRRGDRHDPRQAVHHGLLRHRRGALGHHVRDDHRQHDRHPAVDEARAPG